MDDLNQLKEDLKKELEGESIDFSRIVSLSQQIACLDEHNVRFSVDASHISKIGLQLVAKQETAVAELVKNGYDADAVNVDLIFRDTDKPGGVLEVIDNGKGMTRQQLVDGFMRISTADKIVFPTSEIYKRQRAGRKGIGRFAAQRLGTHLVVVTQTVDQDFALKVTIDWKKFEANQDLITISNRIEKVSAQASVGTTLVIENLRDSWSNSQIKEAYRYICDLQQPYPISKSKKVGVDPGFKAAFYKQINTKLEAVADEESSFFDHALAIIEGRVDESGQGLWSVMSEKLGINESDNKIGKEKDVPTSKLSCLPPVNFRAYYYILTKKAGERHIPPSVFNSVQSSLIKNGGIRLYRNNFRVLPYGEPYDDWLKLAKSSAVREILPPHNNNNFFGVVEIIDPDGAFFEETSSREGLLENESFKELQDFISRALRAAVIRIGEVRDKKTHASHKKKSTQETLEEKAKRIAEKMRSAIEEDDVTESNDSSREKTEDSITESLADEVLELGQESQRLLEENALLRVLASLGLTIGEFTHEIRHSLGAMVANLNLVSLKAATFPEISSPCDGLKNSLSTLQSYARYFDEAITDNAHRNLQPLELRDLINSFKNVVAHFILREGIALDIDIKGYDLFTKPMHKSEWSSLLLNLFSNSLKAINRAQVDGKILIKAGHSNGSLFLEFADNGDGIPVENEERIFDAFFTTSSPPGLLAIDSEELTGTGLGLKIVRDIIESVGGKICLVAAPHGFSTCFRIEIPKAKEKEIPEDAY